MQSLYNKIHWNDNHSIVRYIGVTSAILHSFRNKQSMIRDDRYNNRGYVQRLCTEVMYRGYVQRLCTEVMYRGYVQRLCTEVMYRGYVQRLCTEVMY